MESTYAHIEKNVITRNYKANIAFGGLSSSDTVIVNNEITECRQEGIFAIECGFAWIHKNEITDNSDGIVLFDSCPHIADNDINQNQRSGISCCGASFPKIEKNQIYGNMQSGINIRDHSECVLKGNEIFSNYYQMSCRGYSKIKQNEIKVKNNITGDSEFSSDCILF